jgi:branched-subunit amino acid transport protein
MTANFIYLSILVASIATYACRAFGVFSSKNLSVDSPIFHWIKCISVGIISAVIAKIILFPVGLLSETTSISRIVSTLVAIAVYFLFKKNVLLSVFVSTATFLLINFYL